MSEIKTIVDSTLHEIIGSNTKKSKIIKVNNENLKVDGDVSFPSNLLAWRGLVDDGDSDFKLSKTILEYYLRRKNVDPSNFSSDEIVKKALQLLITSSEQWNLRIENAALKNEKVCVFLNRSFIIPKIIKETIKQGKAYGQQPPTDRTIFFDVNSDPESNLTTFRLQKLKAVAEKILTLQGVEVTKNAEAKFLLTTKSEGSVEDGLRKFVCGVVKNPETNAKEISETYETYLSRKMKELEELNEGRESDSDLMLKCIAEAITTFEFLGVRPSRPSFIETSRDRERSIASTKGGSFVLYNAARIEAILSKFKSECKAGRYPEIWSIEDVDYERLSSEEEWSLIYNFILGYPQLLLNSAQYEDDLELCPQFICSFLSQLSQKFSVYYRRTRILTEGRENLLPALMARLYLLKALQVVINGALDILGITPIPRM